MCSVGHWRCAKLNRCQQLLSPRTSFWIESAGPQVAILLDPARCSLVSRSATDPRPWWKRSQIAEADGSAIHHFDDAFLRLWHRRAAQLVKSCFMRSADRLSEFSFDLFGMLNIL